MKAHELQTDPLADRRLKREAAVRGVIVHREESNEDESAEAPKVQAPMKSDPASAAQMDQEAVREEAPAAPPRKQTARKKASKPRAAVAPEGDLAMPAPIETAQPRVQFGPRVRSDVLTALRAFCSEWGTTLQASLEMALAEWLTRRGYPVGEDIIVPELPGPVTIAVPAGPPGIPMPPRKGPARKQLNVRLLEETNSALDEFVKDRSVAIQDVVDLAIAEFLAARGSWTETPAQS